MANRFFIPRQRNQLLDVARLGLSLAELRQRGRISELTAETAARTETRAGERLALERKKAFGFDRPVAGTEGKRGMKITTRVPGSIETAAQRLELEWQEGARKQAEFDTLNTPLSDGAFSQISSTLTNNKQLNEAAGFDVGKAAVRPLNFFD